MLNLLFFFLLHFYIAIDLSELIIKINEYISEFKKIKAKNGALEKVTFSLFLRLFLWMRIHIFLSISNLVSVFIYISFLLTSRPKDFDFKSRLNRRYFCTSRVCAKCLKNGLFLLVYIQIVNFYNSLNILASILWMVVFVVYTRFRFSTEFQKVLTSYLLEVRFP